MLLMGDEVRRTQQGNNNAYCQDNAISWFDWDDVARHAGHPAVRPRADPFSPRIGDFSRSHILGRAGGH